MVFYRKYRPQKLSDLVGQEGVKESLLAALESGKISHGYLFSGVRGTGKTSTARIFAKAVNCERYKDGEDKFGEPCNKCENCKGITAGSSLDLIEIDAASNRGIDEIRELREKVKLSPVSSRFKVYIIDEAHMLTTEAFNALLKTLEEPPSHVIFILCTTEANKFPQTIISRLSRFDFRGASKEELAKAISNIAKSEDLKMDQSGVEAIVKAADGSFRDAISILDQLSSSKKIIDEKLVNQTIRSVGGNELLDVVDKLAQKDIKELIGVIEKMGDRVDFADFGRELILYLEKVLFCKIGVGDYKDKEVEDFAQKFDWNDLQNLMKLLLVAEGEMKIYPMAEIPLVLAFVKYCGQGKVENSGGREKSGPVKEEEGKREASSKPLEEKVAKAKGKEETAPKPKKPSGHSKLTIDDIQNNWPKFLVRIKPVNAHLASVLRATRPKDFVDGTLGVEAFFRFHKDKLEEPKIMDLLCQTLSEVMGERIVLKIALAEKGTKPTKAVAESNVMDINSDELSQMAQEIFSK